MISFDTAHAAVHYPPDRRLRIWIRPSILISAAVLVAVPVLAAWTEVLFCGPPLIFRLSHRYFQTTSPDRMAFRCGLRYSHFFNFLFVTMLIRSGLSIPQPDHPRLYFNNHCPPGSE